MTARFSKIIARLGFVVLLFTAVAGYAFLKTRDILAGARIELAVEPTPIATDPLLSLAGKISREGTLHINGRRVQTDQVGNFSDTLLLQKGYNVITLEITSKFGRKAQKVYQIMQVVEESYKL